MEEGSFREVDALTAVTLPNGLKYIASYVFDVCPNIATLNLPSSLESIGFASLCSIKVSSIVVPKNITALNGYFLARCPELTSVVLPSTLTEIKWYDFEDDPKLKTVTCKAATPPVITAGTHVFKDTPIASATLLVPAGSKALYQAAEGWKGFDTIVEF